MSFGNLITTTAASISSGGTINGSLTIDGDLTVNGDGSGNYDEIVNGNLTVSSTNKLVLGGDGSDTYIQESSADVLDIYVGGANMIKLTESTTDTVLITGDLTVADGTGSKPLIIVKNTANDTTGSELRFVMDKGSAGADGDDIGTISFYSDNSAQEQTAFASIVAEVSEADDTDEAGKLSFFVSESNGTTAQLTAGLILEGEHATDGEVDVTIGAGSSSTTTIAGDLVVTGSSPSPFASGDTNNYVCTSNGSGQLVGESNITYDGTTFTVSDAFALGSDSQFTECAKGVVTIAATSTEDIAVPNSPNFTFLLGFFKHDANSNNSAVIGYVAIEDAAIQPSALAVNHNLGGLSTSSTSRTVVKVGNSSASEQTIHYTIYGVGKDNS